MKPAQIRKAVHHRKLIRALKMDMAHHELHPRAIAQQTGLTEAQVNRAAKALAKKGALRIVNAPSLPNVHGNLVLNKRYFGMVYDPTPAEMATRNRILRQQMGLTV